MRIAVIGAGNIGGTLGRAWLAAGHEVRFGVPSPEKYAELTAGGATVTTVGDAVEGAGVVVLAMPGGAVGGILSLIAAGLDGVVVLDATNSVGGGGPLNASASVAAAAPNAVYYRAFNTLGWENFANPTFDGVAADHFFSAPRADRDAIERLISDVGLRPAYLGPDKQDLVDSVLPLWLTLAQLRGQRHLAFRIVQD